MFSRSRTSSAASSAHGSDDERIPARFEGVARHGLQAADSRFDAAMYSLLPADLARPWAP